MPNRYVPASLARLLQVFRPCFTAPTFATFTALAVGLGASPAARSVCGMWQGAGLAESAHHARADRFSTTARLSGTAPGAVLIRLIIGHLVPAGAPVLIAVDDTFFRRAGRKIDGAFWAYDDSQKEPAGSARVSWGNTFVIVAILVDLPFLPRPAALPVLARLWRKGEVSKVEIARELMETLAITIAHPISTWLPTPATSAPPCASCPRASR